MKENSEFKIILLKKKYYLFLENNPFNFELMVKKRRPFFYCLKNKIFNLEVFYIVPFTTKNSERKFDIKISDPPNSSRIIISKSIPILCNPNFIKFIDLKNKKSKQIEPSYQKIEQFCNDNQNIVEIQKKFDDFLKDNIDNFYNSYCNNKYYPVNILRLINQSYFYEQKKENVYWKKLLLSRFWFYINDFNFSNKNKIEKENFKLIIDKNKIIFNNKLDSQEDIIYFAETENLEFDIFWKKEFCEYLDKNKENHINFLRKYSYPFSQNNSDWLDIWELQKGVQKFQKSNEYKKEFLPKIKNKLIEISLPYLNTKENFELLGKWLSNDFFEINVEKFNLLKIIWEIEQIEISSNSFRNNFLCLSDELIEIILSKISLTKEQLIKDYNEGNSNIFEGLNEKNLNHYLKQFDPKWKIPKFIKKITKLLEFEKIIGENEIENYSEFNKFIDFLKKKIEEYKYIFNEELFHLSHYEKLIKLESKLSKTKIFNHCREISKEYDFLIRIKQLSKLNKTNLKLKIINLNENVSSILLDIFKKTKEELYPKLKKLLTKDFLNIKKEKNSSDEINNLFIYFSKTKNKIFLDKNLLELEQLLIQERRIGVNERLTRNLSNGQDYKEFLISQSKKYIQRYNINIHSENIKNEAEKILNIIQQKD